MKTLHDLVLLADSVVWGPYFLIPLLLGTGIFVTLRLFFIQFRGLPHGIALVTGKYDDPNDPGELDLNCAGATLETGWFEIDSIAVRSVWGHRVANDGAVYGAVTSGARPGLDGGRLLWVSRRTQTNGAFSRF